MSASSVVAQKSSLTQVLDPYLPQVLIEIVKKYVIDNSTIAPLISRIQNTFLEYTDVPRNLPLYFPERFANSRYVNKQSRALMTYKKSDEIGKRLTDDFLQLKNFSEFSNAYDRPCYYSRHSDELAHRYTAVIGGTPEGNRSRF